MTTQDDLSKDTLSPVGIDLVAGTLGAITRVPPGLTPAATPGTLTATGTGPAVEMSGHGTARLDLVVTAATGTTPTDTITIQTSSDNGVNDAWRTVAAFTEVTADGTSTKCFAGCDRWIRASHVITGTTPSFTFTLSGEIV